MGALGKPHQCRYSWVPLSWADTLPPGSWLVPAHTRGLLLELLLPLVLLGLALHLLTLLVNGLGSLLHGAACSGGTGLVGG